MQFKGAFTALVTPFSNGLLDEEAYRQLIEWQLENGINGVVPCGTSRLEPSGSVRWICAGAVMAGSA